MDVTKTRPRTWCRLWCDIRHSLKLSRVSFEARWIFVCFLTLETDDSLTNSPDFLWLSRQCGVTPKHLNKALSELRNVGLLTDENRVTNFQARQYLDVGAAERQQRHRDNRHDGAVTRDVTRNVTKRNARYRPEAEILLRPSSLIGDPEAPEAAAADPIQGAVTEIVAHLNSITGRKFDPAGAHTELRRALKRDGLTPVEARGILDHLWSEWGADPKMARCVDTATPFRKSNLPRYRDAIAAGPVGCARPMEY
jgi:hypothetical protein